MQISSPLETAEKVLANVRRDAEYLKWSLCSECTMYDVLQDGDIRSFYGVLFNFPSFNIHSIKLDFVLFFAIHPQCRILLIAEMLNSFLQYMSIKYKSTHSLGRRRQEPPWLCHLSTLTSAWDRLKSHVTLLCYRTGSDHGCCCRSSVFHIR